MSRHDNFQLPSAPESYDATQPLVSIVIPVFNGENYLREAIDSALAQTYPNVEVIVVNDGSTDGTAGIAAGYADRIVYLEQPNGGAGAALNTGIAHMRGAYFSWLSHDDLYTPDKLARQVAALEGLADKQTVIYSGYDVIDSRGARIASFDTHHYTPAQLATPLFALTKGILHGCTLLIHRDLFARFGTFDASARSAHDYLLWFKMLRQVPIHFVDAPLVKARVHASRGTNVNPGYIDECNALWTMFADQITAEEATRLAGSRHRFLATLAEFLKTTPYGQAQLHAAQLAERALAQVKVSVVIPFHNRIPLTVEAIRSALDQSHANVEVIAVDDASSDNVRPILTMAAADSRLRYERIDKAGVSAARNRGVALSTGEYVAFLDSDDLFLPEKVAVQLDFMARLGFGFSHTSYETFGVDEASSTIHSGTLTGRVPARLLVECPIATSTVMVSREIALAYPFPPGVPYGEDVVAWLDMLETHRIGGLDAALTRVRLRSDRAAVDPVKQSLGLMAIASHLLVAHGARESEAVGAIIRNLATLHPAPPPAGGPGGSLDPRWRSLVRAFVWYVRNRGLRSALGKVASTLSRR